MHQYVILQDPGHNRVYYAQALKLSAAELTIASKRFKGTCTEIKQISISDIPYLSFTLEKDITEHDLGIISRLSFVFSFFEYKPNNESVFLIPIAKHAYEYVDQKISSLLKYPGKTNELFTKMMVNIALLCSDFSYEDNIQLLDPVAGRGTTLYEAAVYGFDCFGIELELKSANEAQHFFKRFLKEERWKHRSAERSFKAADQSKTTVFEFEYAKDKILYKNENQRKNLTVFNANSTETDRFFKKESIHLIVGDLPYGIAHGNTAKKKHGSITRSPEALIKSCLPGWEKVLHKGGCIVLAWNTFVLPKNQLSELFNKYAFDLLSDGVYNEFEHRVDNAIKRDIIIARKK